MTHARSQHPNARLTPKHRRNMFDCLLAKDWTIEATAERFQVDAQTVRKWRDRFLEHREAGLQDRSARPHLTEPHAPVMSATGDRAAQEAPLGRRPHRARARPGRLDGCERVITDNGSCYRSRLARRILIDGHDRQEDQAPPTADHRESGALSSHLLEEWACIRSWMSDAERTAVYDDFIHVYNRHRSHGALGRHSPMHPRPATWGQRPRRAHS